MAVERIDRLEGRQIEDLHRLYQGEWWTSGRGFEDVRDILAGSDAIFAFADAESGRLRAFARVITDWICKALILDVIVDPAARGEGLGRRLMAAIATDPRLARVAHLELYCRPELLPFYAKWGFTAELGDLRFLRATRDPGERMRPASAKP
jgi:GNAT superfamily N-acetyltransferase